MTLLEALQKAKEAGCVKALDTIYAYRPRKLDTVIKKMTQPDDSPYTMEREGSGFRITCQSASDCWLVW